MQCRLLAHVTLLSGCLKMKNNQEIIDLSNTEIDNPFDRLFIKTEEELELEAELELLTYDASLVLLEKLYD